VRILLDESLPRPLAKWLSGHDVQTVTALQWAGIKNGDLLKKAADSFDAVLTADQNIEFQQNLAKLPIAVVVLVANTNRIESLQPLVPAVLRALETLQPKTLCRVGA
jgi:predicted nuclease of predicted toxin-antitoxin system